MTFSNSVLWLLVLFLVNCEAHVLLSTDAAALMDFKTSLDVEFSYGNWSDQVQLCSWKGVTCHPDYPGRVQRLRLCSLHLSGKLSPSLGMLEHLEYLELCFDNLHGTIPVELGNCTFLKVLRLVNFNLDLSSNRLTGVITAELGNCTNLEALDLSHNCLTGSIPPSLTGFPEFSFVNVAWNNLEGVIPTFKGFFWVASFTGNPLLCGEPVDRPCRNKDFFPVNKPWKKKSLANPSLFHKWWLLSASAIVFIGGLATAFIIYRYIVKTRQASKTYGPGPFHVSFSQEQLLEIIDTSDGNIIGEGGYSTVFSGTWNGTTVAIKMMDRYMKGSEVRKSFLSEAKTLAKLRHRNIVKVLGYSCRDQLLALVMEYMPNGCLASYLAKNSLDSASNLNIALDIAHGLHYMHYEFDKPVIHCDLKPDNILLDSDLTAHISDFGISKLVHGNDNTVTATSFRGTIGYAPPEYAQLGTVSTMGDVYSYGMLLLVMIFGRSPTDKMFHETGGCLRDWVMDICSAQTADRTHKLLVQVALLCTASRPSSRPNMKEVLAMLMEVKNEQQIVIVPSLETLANTPASLEVIGTSESSSGP